MSLRSFLASALILLFLSDPVGAEGPGRGNYGLWGGQAKIRLPAIVKLERKSADRYTARLRGKSSDHEAVLERGQIPRKYNRVSTERMGAIARDRLKDKDYKIIDFKAGGRTVTIVFGGTETVTVQTRVGPMQVQVPWRARLRWVRQTDHQTYQSMLRMPSSDWSGEDYEALRIVASSLRVPKKKVSHRDRLKDAAASAQIGRAHV